MAAADETAWKRYKTYQRDIVKDPKRALDTIMLGDMPTTKIDMILHYPYGVHGGKLHSGEWFCIPIDVHEAHQVDVIELLRLIPEDIGQIFNDRSMNYPYRAHLKGETGRPSSVLISCYFSLYKYLLSNGVKINIDADRLTFFHIVSRLDMAKVRDSPVLPELIKIAAYLYGTPTEIRYTADRFLSEPWAEADYGLWEYIPCYISVNAKTGPDTVALLDQFLRE